MRSRLLLAAVLGLILVGVGAPRTGAREGGAFVPRVLVRVSGEVAAFAQDGDRVAWSSFGTTSCPSLSGPDWQPAVHVLRLTTGARIGLPSKRGSKSCAEFGDVYPASTLALAGTRALWAAYTQSHQETDGYFVTAAANDRVERRVCTFGVVGGSEDNYTPTLATAGDGRTLVFSMGGDAGAFGRVCSGIWRVDPRGRASRIIASPSMLFAVAGQRIAVAQTVDNGGCLCNSRPRWAPGGTRIAFVSARSGRSEIYLVNADGTGERRLSEGGTPDWSPDGSRIVFARQRGDPERGKIVVLNADGRGERVIGAGSGPRWSPTGALIAFNKLDADGLLEVHVMNSDGSGARNLGHGEGQTWSPDGSRLALKCGHFRLCVIGADGTGRRMIGRSIPASFALAWSPDGTRIAYTANELGAGSGVDIHVVNADGSGDHALTAPGSADGGMSWSPDGRRIAFLRGSWASRADGSPIHPRLWTMFADGTAQRKLTTADANEYSPVWSPDGMRIAVARGELYVVGADGRRQTRLTTIRPTEARSSVGLYSAASGRRLVTTAAAGRVQAVALSQSTVALLVAGFFGRRIELFDPASTASRGTVAVPVETVPELSASGTDVVFRVGNTIFLLDRAHPRMRILAVARSTPIGLSIEGRRVAWAESSAAARGGRILAVLLKRP